MRIGVLEDDADFERFKEFLRAGIYDTVQFDVLCVAVEMPDYVKRDERARLDSTDTPAVRWPDGCGALRRDGAEMAGKNRFDGAAERIQTVGAAVEMQDYLGRGVRAGRQRGTHGRRRGGVDYLMAVAEAMTYVRGNYNPFATFSSLGHRCCAGILHAI